MSTPTPRTDAAWAKSFSPKTPGFNMRDLACTLERELATERANVRLLLEALENLCDEQNDAPLETRRDQWQAAMDKARAALAATEGAK